MKQVDYLSTLSKPVPIILSVSHIPNEYTLHRVHCNFQVRALDEHKSMTTNFAKVHKRGREPKPELKGGMTIQDFRGSECRQVRHSDDELIPEVEWGIARKAHGTTFVHEGAVKLFNMAILHRCVGSSEVMRNAAFSAPASHVARTELPIVSHQIAEFLTRLILCDQQPFVQLMHSL